VRTAALAAALALAAGPAGAACRLALALGLDVSASVDAAEYRLQTEGLAAALGAPSVRGALLADPGAPVALAVYEWSGWADQRLIVDWVSVTDAGVLEGVIGRLAATERQPMDDSTALGAALIWGGALLARAPACDRAVLDISGDGKNNDGPDPDMLEAEVALAGVTVNGLVIGVAGRGPEDMREVMIGEMVAYFHAQVIRGPDAFVEAALGYADYERAMAKKLLRELGGYVVGAR
jgi:hypothetical protein